MSDEMSIKKHVEWNGKEFNGFVDLGTGVKDDSLSAASNALVFMLYWSTQIRRLHVGTFSSME